MDFKNKIDDMISVEMQVVTQSNTISELEKKIRVLVTENEKLNYLLTEKITETETLRQKEQILQSIYDLLHIF